MKNSPYKFSTDGKSKIFRASVNKTDVSVETLLGEKTKIIILVILIIFVVLLFVRFIGPEDTWLCQNGEWIKHGNPDRPKPEETLCISASENIENQLRNYLEKNISDISPEKEVLGGKFYITKLTLISSDKAEVEYEDGHIALKADFNFSIVNDIIDIGDFVIIDF